MAKIRTSPAGRYLQQERSQRGFTLLELLVVLTIIVLAATLLPGFILGSGTTSRLDHTARAVVDGMRDVRGSAIEENRDGIFVVDVAERRFQPGATAKPVQIDADIDVNLITARREQLSETIGQIRFFSDGSSTGGRVVLAIGSAQHAIEVDWLTGSISADRNAP